MEPSGFTTPQQFNTNTYFLVVNGRPEGPFSTEQIKALKIKPGDFLKTAAMDDYKEAHEIAELRQLLGFNEQALIPQYFGSFDQRLMASALDWFFVSGVCIIVAFIIALFINDPATRTAVTLGVLAVIPFVKFIYHSIMESSAKQATIGKQILNIRVCDMQGVRLSLMHAGLRNLAKALSVMTFFIGYLFSFFTRQQQCLHDMVTGTLVMKDRLL
jgi:uncharacterized RDD family membrane protein YckC